MDTLVILDLHGGWKKWTKKIPKKLVVSLMVTNPMDRIRKKSPQTKVPSLKLTART